MTHYLAIPAEAVAECVSEFRAAGAGDVHDAGEDR